MDLYYMLVVFLLVTVEVVETRRENAVGTTKKRGERQKNLSEEPSFYLPEKIRHRYRSLIISYNERKGDKRSDWLNTDVTTKTPGLPAMNNTCPWKYVFVHNKNRIPKDIIEAECLSDQCSLPGSGPFAESGVIAPKMDLPSTHIMRTSKCEKVTYLQWVQMAKIHKNGTRTYEKRLLPITAGCTCNLQVKHTTSMDLKA